MNEPELVALRVPPHSTEAEQSVIGAVLMVNDAFEKIAWLKAEAFYEDRHRRIWSVVSSMLESGKPADMLTTVEAMGDDVQKVGGPAYIAELCQHTPSVNNVVRYAEIVRSKSLLREYAQCGTEIAEKALVGAIDPMKLGEEAEAAICAVRESLVVSSDIAHIGQAATEYVEWVDEHPTGIATGLTDLDALTGGLLPGNLVIVAGRTHMGKTALALQFMERICETEPGIMFSLESQRREIAGRLVEWHKHRIGRDAAMDKVFKLRFFIDESSTLSPALMRARLRRMKKRHGLSVAVVDYLQLMEGRGDSREQEVAYISRQLKSIAKDFQIPVIALAQLNRKVEERADKRPHMSDLRESGGIEQDADLILLTYRPDYYDNDFQGTHAEAEIIVPKNRNTGRNGLVKVMFNRDIGRFGDFVPERFRAGVA